MIQFSYAYGYSPDYFLELQCLVSSRLHVRNTLVTPRAEKVGGHDIKVACSPCVSMMEALSGVKLCTALASTVAVVMEVQRGKTKRKSTSCQNQ